jgi:hypothetical protein
MNEPNDDLTPSKHPGGRPTKRTPEVVEKIAQAIASGLTDQEAAALANVHPDALRRWKKDPEFADAIAGACAQRLQQRIQRVEAGDPNWQSSAWLLERCYGTRFSKPEVQISAQANIQNNLTFMETQELLKENWPVLARLIYGPKAAHLVEGSRDSGTQDDGT